MWLTGAAGVLFGIICTVQQACSESKVIHRKAVPTPHSPTSMEEDVQTLINQIHSLSDSDPGVKPRSSTGDPLPANGVDLNNSILDNVCLLLQPILRKGFIEDLPKTLVCILSGKEDCGVEAKLINDLSKEIGPTILAGLTSLTTPTCSLLDTDKESYSFFRTYLRMSDSTVTMLTGFQDILLNILTYFPVSGNQLNTGSDLLDTIIKYTIEILFSILEVPLEYIKIALQLGIRVPTLDEQHKCEHGDLKQLIMWGLRNNVSWSFGTALVDILLDIFFPLEQSHCTEPGPGCPNPGVPLQRSILDSNNNVDLYRNTPLQCDHKDLAELNDTVCSDIIAKSRKPSSVSVLFFCQAMNSLDSKQTELLWRNTCSLLQAVMSPLTSRSTGDCIGVGTYPSPVINPPAPTPSISQQDVPMRIVREASNLNELICDYDFWKSNITVDPVLVSLCGDNQGKEFVENVCNDATLLTKLVSDPINLWLYAYCGNSTADLAYMVSEHCHYEQWMREAMVIDPYHLEFCMILDREQLSLQICQNVAFFVLLFSNPLNIHLMPNCSEVSMPTPPGPSIDAGDPCQYSHWHDPFLIHVSIIHQCSVIDSQEFNREVCANQTFLNQLLINEQNDWLQQHCKNAVLETPPSFSNKFNKTELCDYDTWASQYVDDSIVGWCYQHDKVAFQKNVCCNVTVFEKLLQNPRNMWLQTSCNESEEIDHAQLINQICKYTEWTTPIIVDMTDLAACAWADPDNFFSKVCLDDKVLANLLANKDNTWLIQYCSNYTNPGGNHNESVFGFKPSEQCHYLSWSISLPDPALVNLCSSHDQDNFVSSVCTNPNIFSAMSQEPANAWVGPLCASYTNHTDGDTVEPPDCLAKDLVKKFNWTCTQDLALACQPDAGQNAAMRVVLRCWLESVRSRMGDLLSPEVTATLDQAVSLAVVSLLALEEIQNTSYHVTENIQHDIMAFVHNLFKKETNFVKKRVILQCFGRVLTSLMPKIQDTTQHEFVFIQEYFKIPVDKVQAVLSECHITTIRMILLYYSKNKETLQLPEEYLPTLTSVLFQTHLATDWSLFPELASFLGLASPADIQGLPLLQNNIKVREIINQNLALMTLEQRRAFGVWFAIIMDPITIIGGQQSLIRDTGNLITYLPFNNFQHLSAAQLLDGLDVLQQNTLSPIKQEFIAQRIIGTYKNLTSQDFIRLGNITCFADAGDLVAYKGTEVFAVIQDMVRKCARDGLNLPSYLFSSVLLNSTLTQEPSSLTVDQIKESAYLLPMLGVGFIQNLSPSQLQDVLPVIKSLTFSGAQVSLIVEKLSSVMDLNFPGTLQELGSLVLGVKSELFLTMTSDKLLASLPSMAQQKVRFNPAQANTIVTKLWGFSDVFSWLDNVEPLLYCTPLASVLPRTRLLVLNSSKTVTKPWNTQQAQAIFKKVLELKPNLIKEDFQSLGTLGQGVTCKVLLERLRKKPSPSSVRQILHFLQQQPSPLHTSLKKCVVDEVYQYKFFPEVIAEFGAELVLAIPLSNIKKFTMDIVDSVRALIIAKPQYFLSLSRRKKELLVDKIVEKMNMYTGVYTKEEFLSLGVMATFVTDKMFDQLDRNFFMDNLDFLQTFCYGTTKMDIVARMLQEADTFGLVKNWTVATLSQVKRFLFFLPTDKLKEIPQELMTDARIEKLFMSQQEWERGAVGRHCLDAKEKRSNFIKQRFFLQFFLGFLKVNSLSKPPVPTCEILRSTGASVWPISSLVSMSTSAFVNCLELMGQDPFLSADHRNQLLQQVKAIFGQVATFSQLLISQLGIIAVEMTNEELRSLRLTQRNTIATLGAVDIWTSKQQEILFTAVLNSTKQRVSQLDSSTLVAMGHFVCGCSAKEMENFNAVELSKAVHYLGQLKLKCSEEQLGVMIMLLNNPLALGLTSSWGTDIFIEIGILAAGVSDRSMSALVRFQIEGITALAISVISPAKFSIVFSPEQIRMFSYDQAEAVPLDTISRMSPLQKNALAMVLSPYEDRLVNFRGRSLGRTLSHCPVCLLLGLLMLLIV